MILSLMKKKADSNKSAFREGHADDIYLKLFKLMNEKILRSHKESNLPQFKIFSAKRFYWLRPDNNNLICCNIDDFVLARERALPPKNILF
jgi:hypothetical protein